MAGERGVVKLPALLLMRLRSLLQRQRKGKVTQGMVEAEIARRLRVSFAIDDLVQRYEGDDR